MKYYRGAALASVRSAIWRVFGAEKLPLLRSNALLADIVLWKNSAQVSTCFGALFEKKYFAATVETVGTEPSEKSLINDGRILIVVVPHAADIFLDITTDLNFHSFRVLPRGVIKFQTGFRLPIHTAFRSVLPSVVQTTLFPGGNSW